MGFAFAAVAKLHNNNNNNNHHHDQQQLAKQILF